MTEAEAIAALTDVSDLATAQMSVWLSVTFAYLTVAYLVGEELSRLQCLAISILYTVTAGFFGSAAMLHAQAWVSIRARERTIYDESWIYRNFNGWEEMIAIFLIAGTLLSLYFMYNVRTTKAA